MPATRTEILRLLDRLADQLGPAFLGAVSEITSRAQLQRLIDALDVGDIDRAMDAAGIRSGSWATLTEANRSAFLEAGAFTIAADVPKRFGMTFDINNPRAERWIRQHSSDLITYINADQRDAIRAALTAGLEAGRNPRSVALDIIGRVSPQTGKRAGGIIGLNEQQARYVMNARKELESLDPNYFTRTRRDKRFDSIVRKAIDSDTPLDGATIERLTGRYSDRLLQTRGTTVGRTEALKTLNAAADEALQQVVDEGLAPPDAVKRIWRHSFSPNERPGHLAMSGEERGLNEPFTNPVTGAVLMRPGDGPASEAANCRCLIQHRIDFVAVELAA